MTFLEKLKSVIDENVTPENVNNTLLTADIWTNPKTREHLNNWVSMQNESTAANEAYKRFYQAANNASKLQQANLNEITNLQVQSPYFVHQNMNAAITPNYSTLNPTTESSSNTSSYILPGLVGGLTGNLISGENNKSLGTILGILAGLGGNYLYQNKDQLLK